MNTKHPPYNILNTVLLLHLLLIFLTSFIYADTIVLKNGNRIKCEKSWDENDQTKCMRDGGIIGFSKESVEQIKKETVIDTSDQMTLKMIGSEGRKVGEQINEILKNIKEKLSYTWDIISIEVKRYKLIVALNHGYINKKGYLSMLPWICDELCEYPYLCNQIEEIRVLNSSENQGWIYSEGKCDAVRKTPLNQVDELIANNSKEFDSYEERSKQVAKEAMVLLRNKPSSLKSDNVKKILIKYNFYSKCNKKNKGACNPEGNFPNQFIDNKDGSIKDLVTGLIWQKAGSSYTMEGVDAQSYINNLNRKKFLGYNDWKLPTIEELASTIEPEKSLNNLHINPLFSSEQDYCWSSDKLSSDVFWCVYFGDGSVMTAFHKTWQFKVRAVR